MLLTLWAKKCFPYLILFLGDINRKNFMVSCFPLINRPVWTSVTMVTKQNLCFLRHSPSSCSAVLVVVTHQVKAFVFKSKWLRSLILVPLDMTVNEIFLWKSSSMFRNTYIASLTLKQSCKLFGQDTFSETCKKF